MKTSTTHTLNTIDAALRLNDRSRQPWHDPEFLAWEHGQVEDEPRAPGWDDEPSRYIPGPAHHIWDEVNEARDHEDTVHRQPIITLLADHPDRCLCETEGAPGLVLVGPAVTRSTDYPAPKDTVHGPLLLGPEPGVVRAREAAW